MIYLQTFNERALHRHIQFDDQFEVTTEIEFNRRISGITCNIPERKLETLKKLFNDHNYELREFHGGKTKDCVYASLNNKGMIHIFHCDDNYYMIEIGKNHYKCDEFPGLIKFLKTIL